MDIQWVFTDPFHSIYVYSTTIFSVFTNSFLILIILNTKGAEIGAYRYLLMAFAGFDTITSISHLVIEPLVHMTPNGFIFFSNRGAQWKAAGGLPGLVACTIFMATFYQTFLVLAYHFIYRLLILTRPRILSFTYGWSTKKWMVASGLFNVVYSSYFVIAGLTLCVDDYTRQYVTKEMTDSYPEVDFLDNNVGYYYILYWRQNFTTGEVTEWHPSGFIGISFIFSMFSLTGYVILICIGSITRVLKSNTSLASNTRRMQHQLFKALLIQTCVPCCFSYLPLTTILMIPMTGIDFGAIGSPLIMTTAIFPAIDALFVIAFVARFRRAFVSWLRAPWRLPNGDSSTGSSTSRVNTIHSASFH